MQKLFGKIFPRVLTISGGLLYSVNAIAADFPLSKKTSTIDEPSVTQLADHQVKIAENVSLTQKLTISPADRVEQLSREELQPNLELTDSIDSDLSEPTDSLEQVTSVSQLRDVQPTDWAFVALQSLVERYGCIAGYPNRTYQGNRSMTRYEFAAGLNKCLEQINQIIANRSAGISKEDLGIIQKLQENFASELANLSKRIDTLATKTAALEAQRFSPTTKLTGRVITYLGDAFGKTAGPANHATFGNDTVLNLNSSFTGKDNLAVSLRTGNLQPFTTATKFPQGGSMVLNGFTDEARMRSNPPSEISLNDLSYSFPINKELTVFLGAYSSTRDVGAPITPLNNSTTGPVSYYGKINSLIYSTYQQSTISVGWEPAPWVNMVVSLGTDFTGNDPSVGFQKGGYTATFEPVFYFGRLKLAFSYLNAYSLNSVNTLSGSNASHLSNIGPLSANTYLLAGFYDFSPKFQLGGSVAYLAARALQSGNRGDASIWDYRVNIIFPDLVKKGNLAGLILGIQPRLAGTSNAELARAIGFPPGQRNDRNVGYHIEAFYAHRLNDHISITPGLLWLTAPNHDARNPDVFAAVLRTTLNF